MQRIQKAYIFTNEEINEIQGLLYREVRSLENDFGTDSSTFPVKAKRNYELYLNILNNL